MRIENKMSTKDKMLVKICPNVNHIYKIEHMHSVRTRNVCIEKKILSEEKMQKLKIRNTSTYNMFMTCT